MFNSETISRNMSNNPTNGTMIFPTNNYKHGFNGEISKSISKSSKEKIDSNLFQHQDQQHNQNNNNGGLTRYRSAPSSFFDTLLDTNTDVSSSNGDDDADTMFSNVLNCGNGSSNMEMYSSNSKQERVEYDQQENGFLNGNLKIDYENSMNGNGCYGALIENQMQMKMNGNGNLIRQSSSPAGFFSGFDVMKEVENFKASNGTHAEFNSANNHMNFTAQPSHFSSFIPTIAENSNGNNANDKCYIPGYSTESWNASTSNTLKRNRVDDVKMFSGFNGLENQNGEDRNFVSSLTHHLSLPKTSTEMAAVQKYLHFQQDVVPFKTRAKRGFATHPRSIAERVRRTRINQRMKKIEELFPDMDKQANTSDMLDTAVELIKDLQKHVKTLTDDKAKCTCKSK